MGFSIYLMSFRNQLDGIIDLLDEFNVLKKLPAAKYGGISH